MYFDLILYLFWKFTLCMMLISRLSNVQLYFEKYVV